MDEEVYDLVFRCRHSRRKVIIGCANLLKINPLDAAKMEMGCDGVPVKNDQTRTITNVKPMLLCHGCYGPICEGKKEWPKHKIEGEEEK